MKYKVLESFMISPLDDIQKVVFLEFCVLRPRSFRKKTLEEINSDIREAKWSLERYGVFCKKLKPNFHLKVCL